MNSKNYLIKNNSSKNHYFIGTVINSEDTINQLKVLQNVLKNKKFGIDHFISYGQFYSGFIYLGYLDNNTVKIIKDYLNPLFLAIAEEIGHIECEYTGFEYYHENNIQAVNILYDSKVICDIIVPYLVKCGINNLITNKIDSNIIGRLFIPLISIDKNNDVDTLDENIKQLYIPRNKNFFIDTIDIISGIPVLNNVRIVSSYPLRNN